MRVAYIIALLLFTCTFARAESDEIDAWLKGFDEESLNGTWPSVDLPGNAAPAEVVAAYAKTTKKTVDSAQYDGYRILETRPVPKSMALDRGGTIVLVSSARGSKTILLLFLGGRGWTVRPYFITTVP